MAAHDLGRLSPRPERHGCCLSVTVCCPGAIGLLRQKHPLLRQKHPLLLQSHRLLPGRHKAIAQEVFVC